MGVFNRLQQEVSIQTIELIYNRKIIVFNTVYSINDMYINFLAEAQVSFSDRLSSVVRLSVYFSHLHLLLKNHWLSFNQTWHKASLGEEDSNVFK